MNPAGKIAVESGFGDEVSRGSVWTILPSAASMASMASAGRTMPEAFAFSATCSGLDAPMIADDTLGFRRTQAIASCAGVRPRSAAIGSTPCTAVSVSSLRNLASRLPGSGPTARLSAGSP